MAHGIQQSGSCKEVKHYKLEALPIKPIPDALLYIKGINDEKVKMYVTDTNGIPYPINTGESSGSGIQTLKNSDGTLTIIGVTDLNIRLSNEVLNIINSSLVSGSNISNLVNDTGYITVGDISGKVDKEAGKSLIDNTEIARLSTVVNQDISGKVDKVTGKGLSTNDYTSTEKNKLLSITGINTGDETTTTIQAKRPIKKVNGKSIEGSGNIVLDNIDIGLPNVNNTSDLNKPISIATQTALNNKEPIFTKNTAFNKDFGFTSDTVVEGNDLRLVQAFAKKINAITVTGDSNKIITLTREDGTILTTTFLDKDTEYPDDVINTLTFNANSDGALIAITSSGEVLSVSLDGRYSLLGHTHTISDVTGLQDFLDGKANKDGSNINQSSFRTALGLGSNAYTSTTFLPLTGGALTGQLTTLPAITDTQTPTLGQVKDLLPKSYSTLVYVNSNSPVTATVFDTENPPVTNNDALKNNVNNLYVGENTSTWVYDDVTYKSEEVPDNSNFYFSGTTVDAGNNKVSQLERVGAIKTGGFVKKNPAYSNGILIANGVDINPLSLPVSTATENLVSTKEPIFTKNTAFNKDFGFTAGTVADGSVIGKLSTQSTGYLSGLVLSINADNNKYNLDAGAGVITSFANPLAPTYQLVNFAGITGKTPTYLGTSNITYVAVNTSGVIVEQATPFTKSQQRDLIEVGGVIHPTGGGGITAINNIALPNFGVANQLHDFMQAVGALNVEGNVYSANGANTILNKTAGKLFKIGASAQVDWKNPHEIAQGEGTALQFYYRFADGFQGALRTQIDASNYEVSTGVLAAVSPNKWTIQTINMFQSGLTVIQYGQNQYGTLDEAEKAIATRSFNVDANIKENGVRRAYLVVKNGATALNNPAQAKFLNIEKFGGVSSGGGATVDYATIIAALGYTPANDVDVLHKTGDETKSGTLTLSSNAKIGGIDVGGIAGTGVGNVKLGLSALANITTGNYNIASGSGALQSCTTGSENIASGSGALRDCTTGNYNVASGSGALQSCTTGSENIASGNNALLRNAAGSGNIASGTSALINCTTGNYNVASGTDAGRFFTGTQPLTASENSIFIGKGTSAKANNSVNETVIGFEAVGHGDNTVRIGNSSVLNTYLAGNVNAQKFVKKGATAGNFLKADGSDVALSLIDDGTNINIGQRNVRVYNATPTVSLFNTSVADKRWDIRGFGSGLAITEAGVGNSVIFNAGGSITFSNTITSTGLTVDSTTKGAILPRMTTTQKNAIIAPIEGSEVYDLTLHAKCYYNGTTWKTILTN